MTYTDLAFVRTPEGYYDLDVDASARDLVTTDGLDSAVFVSLFSDRRARPDEPNGGIPDPLRRRGWIGDLVAEVPGDLHGSGLWFFEQSRNTREAAIGLRIEANAALDWLVDEGLSSSVESSVLYDPAARGMTLSVRISEPQGGSTVRAYRLVDATIQRAVTTTASQSI